VVRRQPVLAQRKLPRQVRLDELGNRRPLLHQKYQSAQHARCCQNERNRQTKLCMR
jgi:hypothetical protein